MNRIKIAAGMGLALAILCGVEARAQKPPLLPEKDVAALANEVSGETAKRNLEGIARFHRQRGSKEFHEAAELVAERLRAYGLNDVAILQFPADGKIFYGTQRSRPAWDAEFGILDDITVGQNVPCSDEKIKASKPGSIIDCYILNVKRIASYEAEPVVLAEDSESADATANLVDVGEGTNESDYAGKDVKGKIVLVSAQPGAVQDLSVGKFGAAGIVSYAQNQKTAWSGENQDAIRWGHLETFSPNKTFAFMVSLKTAHEFQARLAKGEQITLHAVVKAGQHLGNYEIATATIPGADEKLMNEEILFSCHLDHERPGANDNASGCTTILEVARTLQKLIDEKKLERPARTIRFVFPPEIEGTMALLNGNGSFAKWSGNSESGKTSIKVQDYILVGPRLAKRIKAVIHMDMVGGGPETKAVFHVTRGPMSLPSFVHDVAWAFADWVNEESYKFAATGKADYPMVAPEGGKEPLRAEYSTFTMGSDHDVYQDSSFGIPAIYLNDWPDRYIHTNFDSAANIDPTKLKRAAFIGAASGYYLAGEEFPRMRWNVGNANLQGGAAREAKERALFNDLTDYRESCEYQRYHLAFQEAIYASTAQLPAGIDSFLPPAAEDRRSEKLVCPAAPNVAGQQIRFRRNRTIKGPLAVFGYDHFADHAKAAGIATPKLLSYEGLWGAGEEYAYEVLNFADGKRNAQEIRDAVSAEYGPVPLELVVEYLKALEKIGIVERVQ